MRESIAESARKNVPVTRRKEDEKWMNPEILSLMEDRRKAKRDEETINRLMKKKCNEAMENWINNQCKEMEANVGVDDKTVQQKIKDICGGKLYVKTGCLQAKDGKILMDKRGILNR